MGCDIHGVFEAHNPDADRWRYLGRLWPHVGRCYDTFGSLFGVRNMAQFEPLFADRGLPDTRGWKFDSIIKEYEDPDYHDGSLIGTVDFHSPTWVMLPELMDVDWDEEADAPDRRYSVLDENKEPTGSKSAWSSGHTQLYQQHEEELAAGEAVPFETSDGEQRYLQRRVQTRREALSGAWEWVIFDLMPLFGERYGEENIRLTVWFDN
jgi:hypothetical protein